MSLLSLYYTSLAPASNTPLGAVTKTAPPAPLGARRPTPRHLLHLVIMKIQGAPAIPARMKEVKEKAVKMELEWLDSLVQSRVLLAAGTRLKMMKVILRMRKLPSSTSLYDIPEESELAAHAESHTGCYGEIEEVGGVNPNEDRQSN